MKIKQQLFEEAQVFDSQAEKRENHGLIPDLRRLKKVPWFYNNVWRDPKFVKTQLVPKVNFIIDIAKKRGGKTLELGCGNGFLSLELARHGLDVTGIDISQKSIDIAQRYAKQNPKKYAHNFGALEYICADILNIELQKETYDNIIYFASLHHITNLEKAIHNAYKALKPSGNLLIYELVRENFTKTSAQIAGLLRAILPTWIPYKTKLNQLTNSKEWKEYVDNIYNEYTYREEFTQSPLNNSIESDKLIINAIAKRFDIKEIGYSDAFINKLIGGLRGKYRYELAKFLTFVDQELIKEKVLPPTLLRIHAVKK